MPTLRVPSLMKFYLGGQTEIPIHGATVSAAIDDVLVRYPTLKAHLFDKNGLLRRHINLFVNENNINDLDGINTQLQVNDKITLIPSISGG